MRLAVGVGVLLAMCSGHVALAEDAAKIGAAGSVKAEIKIASTADAGGDRTRNERTTSAPVSLTSKVVPEKPVNVPPSLIATIDLNAQAMRVTANGRLVGTWPISSGASGHETPAGRFRPSWSSKMHYSRKYDNAPMPYAVFFNGGIATHGTTATGRLGAPASHGCIRLRTANARKFYELVHRHGYKQTRITVTGRAKQTLTAARGRGRAVRRSSVRRNSFSAPATARWGDTYFSRERRYSLEQYDRNRIQRHQQRVQRYYQSRRGAYNAYSR